MPIVTNNQPLGRRPVVILLYGDPGVAKTSLFHTTANPLLLDFDRGVQRSFGRKDALLLDTWQEVLDEERAGSFKGYSTIGIDTAKAALDDFLMVHVAKMDYKLATNKLKAYGAIGDAFKLFVNGRRAEGADIVIIAHGKKDEDTKKIIPDVTGQSAGLLLRIADQVGYVRMENNQRTISFDPTDTTVGKNVAGLPTMVIPDKSTPEFADFGERLIEKVKQAIDEMDAGQRETLEKIKAYTASVKEFKEAADFNDFLPIMKEQPEYIKVALRGVISEQAQKVGIAYSKEAEGYASVEPVDAGEKEVANG